MDHGKGSRDAAGSSVDDEIPGRTVLRAVVVLQNVVVSFNAAHELKERFGGNGLGGAGTGVLSEGFCKAISRRSRRARLAGLWCKQTTSQKPRENPKISIFREKKRPTPAFGTSPLTLIVISFENQGNIFPSNGLIDDERSIPVMYLLLPAPVCQHSVFSKALN